MRIFNRMAVLALLLVLPLALFAQSQDSSQVNAGSDMGLRMSELIGEKALFPNGEEAGTVRDIVVGDKGDLSYLLIEFNRDALGAGTSIQDGTTTGSTTETESEASDAVDESGETAAAETETDSSGTAAAASTNRFLVPVDNVSFNIEEKVVSLSIDPSDVLSLQTLEGDEIPATLGVSASDSMSGGAVDQSATTSEAGTSDTAETDATVQSDTDDESAAATESSSDEEVAEAASGTMQADMGGSTQYFLGSKLKDFTLVDPQGEDLGKIDDAMLDLANHQIAYLALGVGGFLGIGEKMVAVSMADITGWDTAENKIMVTLTADDVRNAEGIDKDNWPASAPGQTQ